MAKPLDSKIVISLWYEKDADKAAQFYAETFPDSSCDAIHRAPADSPSAKEGDVLVVEFTVLGLPCIAINGGPAFPQSEAFSFQVQTDTQEETDRYWNALVDNGGQESQCGWCKDRWGLSWQISPRIMNQAMTSPDRAAAKRATEAMYTMKKIDIATIERALAG